MFTLTVLRYKIKYGMTSMPVNTKLLRSQPTRDRILEQARALFGENGFEKTTVRLVADRAKIHPSLVMRYFGSKEGLFTAAVQFELRLPDLTVVPRAQRGRVLAKHFFDRWEREDSRNDLQALLRVAVTHDEARAQLAEVFRSQLAETITKVVPPDRVSSCAAMIATQAIGLAFTRYILQLPAVVSCPPQKLVHALGAAFQLFLDKS